MTAQLEHTTLPSTLGFIRQPEFGLYGTAGRETTWPPVLQYEVAIIR